MIRIRKLYHIIIMIADRKYRREEKIAFFVDYFVVKYLKIW